MSSKRDRYNNANIRGGMGVRKRLSEDSMRPTYRLNGVQTGAAVAKCLDKFGRWEGGYTLGVIVRRSSTVVQIRWLGDEDITTYSQGDARYEVDRNRWKILGILQADPMNPENPLADALRELARSGIMVSDDDPPPTTEETEEMAKEKSNAAAEREAAQRALKNGDLKARDTYTAKQVAARCGTDSKTMRKFFRSAHSTVEPVGQGGRYEFDAKDFPKIKKEFDAWQKRSRAARQPIDSPAKKEPQQQITKTKVERDPTGAEVTPIQVNEQVDEDAWDPDKWGTPITREPTPEELAELEDVDLDLDDLDAGDE